MTTRNTLAAPSFDGVAVEREYRARLVEVDPRAADALADLAARWDVLSHGLSLSAHLRDRYGETPSDRQAWRELRELETPIRGLVEAELPGATAYARARWALRQAREARSIAAVGRGRAATLRGPEFSDEVAARSFERRAEEREAGVRDLIALALRYRDEARTAAGLFAREAA